MKKSFSCLILASCFVLGFTLAHADSDSSHEGNYDTNFKTMDSNSDGAVKAETNLLNFNRENFSYGMPIATTS